MAPARLLSDMLELFYGLVSQEENQRQRRPIAPERDAWEKYIYFDLVRNNFNGWLRAWRMNIPEGYPYKGDLLQFARKTKRMLTNLIENEIASLEC